MPNFIITEYKEDLTMMKNSNHFNGDIVRPTMGTSSDTASYENDAKDKVVEEEDDDEVVYTEEPDSAGHTEEDHSAAIEYAEQMVHSTPEGEVAEGSSTEVIEGSAEHVLQELGKKLPGVEILVVDEDDEEEEKETDWENDGDPKHFMAYITKAYPSGIPPHDGRSTLGCERAINYLKGLDSEISKALRAGGSVLEPHLHELEDIRVKLNGDISTLEHHAKDLKRKLKNRKAEAEVGDLVKEAELNKTASTPRIQLVVTPFERAICGIITNASISSGKPMETVYEYLKDKYSLDDREELAILQILKDMGHPIFKDRGTLGKTKENKEEGSQGVEFIKNYFA